MVAVWATAGQQYTFNPKDCLQSRLAYLFTVWVEWVMTAVSPYLTMEQLYQSPYMWLGVFLDFSMMSFSYLMNGKKLFWSLWSWS